MINYKFIVHRKVAKMYPYKGQASLMKKKTNHNKKFKEFHGIKKLIAAYTVQLMTIDIISCFSLPVASRFLLKGSIA